MHRVLSTAIALGCCLFAAAQDSFQKAYKAELRTAGRNFTSYFYPHYAEIYAEPEHRFVSRIDSVREIFNGVLRKFEPQLSPGYVRNQQEEIKYYFDRLLMDYPDNHAVYASPVDPRTRYSIPERMRENLGAFNRPDLLANEDFRDYARAFFSYRVKRELTGPLYKTSDNRFLEAAWRLIPLIVSNAECREFWQADYLFNHIDNYGIKNIGTIYRSFLASCKDTSRLNKVRTAYDEDAEGRKGHITQVYKRVGIYDLDIHLFTPPENSNSSKHPVMVYFHGGSWSEGKPDWFFPACEELARTGWVACAVEYRIYGRHGTLPFEAVRDARSAIRWLRQHAPEFAIDTSRIVASGNSAGGHLVLASAMADGYDEPSDNLSYSSSPNLLLVNAGVYDLTDQANAWIRENLGDKTLVRKISPLLLARKNLPPMLLIHGTNDGNVPFVSAQKFVDSLRAIGNTTAEFRPLEGAAHFIWYDPKYSPEVAKLRKAFLNKWGYQ